MINYKYTKTVNFPLKIFFNTITKVKNYKNFLPWCLDSYEKNHKSNNLTLLEIQTKHPELLRNKIISEYLHMENCIYKQNNNNHHQNEKVFNIKSYEGYIKVGFDIIDFSYLSKVYTISNNVVLSITDDSQSHIFQKLESTWILTEKNSKLHSKSNDLASHTSEEKALKCEKESNSHNSFIDFKKLENKNKYKFGFKFPFKFNIKSFYLGSQSLYHKNPTNGENILKVTNPLSIDTINIQHKINVEYFIEFQMKNFLFSNITSLCINFLGENIVKSFISETEKLLKEQDLGNNDLGETLNQEETKQEKYLNMIKWRLNNVSCESNEKLNRNQKEKLEALFMVLFINKKLEFQETENILNMAKVNIGILINLIHFSEILDSKNINQIAFIGSEIKNLAI